jgi:hypothetical protein
MVMKKIMALAFILAVSSPLYGVKIRVHNLYGQEVGMDASWDYCCGLSFPALNYTIKPGYNEIIGEKDEEERPFQVPLWHNRVVNHIGIQNGDFGRDKLEKAVEQGDLSDGVVNIVIISPSEVFLTKNGMRQ